MPIRNRRATTAQTHRLGHYPLCFSFDKTWDCSSLQLVKSIHHLAYLASRIIFSSFTILTKPIGCLIWSLLATELNSPWKYVPFQSKAILSKDTWCNLSCIQYGSLVSAWPAHWNALSPATNAKMPQATVSSFATWQFVAWGYICLSHSSCMQHVPCR